MAKVYPGISRAYLIKLHHPSNPDKAAFLPYDVNLIFFVFSFIEVYLLIPFQ